ncbi:sensor histidine kinase [[Clostridium] polysaccharolyticum]|uniref:Two-component system, sensor histidine kinase YesM n=1 Tax=[Clostridium] polysaccharolyticum TaxID=29364 RepID=A0A1I0CSD1_9FIRM|nr:sensor histidine kinase [[Clostridium] polysaccharolyticum]SET22488.1 two-component system, sensor histidine kinase YesM [[Clostridium] polysaccharolyticum]
MLVVILYNNQTTKKILIEQTMKSEEAELSLIKDAMSENVRIISDISKRLYFDKMIEKIAFTSYKNYEELLADYNNYTKITDCLNDYYQEIASIKIYLENHTISNTANFIYADFMIRNEEWYRNTVKAGGNVYWSYVNDSLTKKKSLRLSRVLYTADMQQVGILVIVMQNKRTELPIANRKSKTLLAYNNKEIVHSNFKKENYHEIIDIIKEHDKKLFYGKVTYEGQESFLVMVRMQPDYSENFFTLASIGPYEQITKKVNQASMAEILPFLVCIAIAGCLIAAFSYHFSRQINQFRKTMHEAANGNFDTVLHLEGNDELSMLYEDLNVMIGDMQALMREVVAEQVQKEKLNSRQKEVEFKMLASQINPHFLYNTLETIRMKAIVNQQPEIAELAKMLAKIMRRNIQVGEKLVTLESELKLVEYYLKIQYYRFGDRIQSSILVDSEVDTESTRIMPLIIQPLVENAFVHGLEAVDSEGKLTIHVSCNTDIFICVEDNGCGISDKKLEEIMESLNDLETLDRTHIGVCNVNQRIKLQYGEDYGLTIETEEGNGTRVTLKIPVVNPS